VVPPHKRVIKRVVLHSNGHGLPPKTLDETATQFKAILYSLRAQISPALKDDPVALLARLREIEPKDLITAVKAQLFCHQFRPVYDNDFIHPDLFKKLRNGEFAAAVLEANIQFLIGECSHDSFQYAKFKPPKMTGVYSLMRRFGADYPGAQATALVKYYKQRNQIPPEAASEAAWRECFGHLYSAAQVYIPQRALVDALQRGGAGHLISRYRIEFRSQTCNPKIFPLHEKATHGTDTMLWFLGSGKSFPDEKEKDLIINGLLIGLGRFLHDGNIGPGWGDYKHQRIMREDGTIDVTDDIRYDEMLAAWKAIDSADGQALDRSKM
jgi:carboxylesterase type B